MLSLRLWSPNSIPYDHYQQLKLFGSRTLAYNYYVHITIRTLLKCFLWTNSILVYAGISSKTTMMTVSKKSHDHSIHLILKLCRALIRSKDTMIIFLYPWESNPKFVLFHNPQLEVSWSCQDPYDPHYLTKNRLVIPPQVAKPIFIGWHIVT